MRQKLNSRVFCPEKIGYLVNTIISAKEAKLFVASWIAKKCFLFKLKKNQTQSTIQRIQKYCIGKSSRICKTLSDERNLNFNGSKHRGKDRNMTRATSKILDYLFYVGIAYMVLHGSITLIMFEMVGKKLTRACSSFK